jgi:hypothetical protein
MLALNPTNDRLKFILKTYGDKYPTVVIDMVDIIAQTVGEDRWFTELREAAEQNDPRFKADLDRWGHGSAHHVSERAPKEFVETLVALVNEMPKFKTRHRADPIFPWIATGLAKRYASFLNDKTNYPPLYADRVRQLRRAGTMLALWYERTRPNLGEYDFDTAIKEAKEWNEEHGPIPQGEIVTQLADGWTAQKLTTPDQLAREGDVMQHCVGSYSGDVEKGRTTIYSLRDKHGRPHVTIEVKNDRFVQIQGKQDTPPAKQYVPYVDEFKEWAEENDISTSRVASHLTEYAAALDEHANDVEEEHIGIYAQDWYDNVGSAEDTVEWLKHGMSYSEAELAGSLESEDVTPEEYGKFPDPVLQKITEGGGVPSGLDKLIAIARMARLLEELASQRVTPEPPSSAQAELFEHAPRRTAPGGRVPGHEPTGTKMRKSWWGDSVLRWPSIDFDHWEGWRRDDEDVDLLWLYPAEEWLAEEFKSDPGEDEYVGPWFLNRFTPEQATEWWDLGIVDGDLAAGLRSYRVKPDIIEKAKEKSDAIEASLDEFEALKKKASWESAKKPALGEGQEEQIKAEVERLRQEIARYAKVIAQQIAEQIDSAGVYRNPKKRTSKRRASRPRR